MSAGSGIAAPGTAGVSDPVLRRELRGPVLIVARGLCLLFAVLALVVYAHWLPHWLDLRLAIARHAATLPGGSPFYPQIAIGAAVAAIAQAVAWGILAGFVFWRRSHDLFGIVIAAAFLSLGIIFTDVDVIIAMMGADSWAPWSLVVILLANSLSNPWLYVFPDGRFVPRWSVALAVAWFAWSMGYLLWLSLEHRRLGGPGVAFNALLVVAGIGAFVYRYLRRADAVQRQ